MSGPSALIDAIARSLFSIGVVTIRIDAKNEEFLPHPQLQELLLETQIRSGLLSLLVRIEERAPLTARAGNEAVTLDAGDPTRAIAEVHRLLHVANILLSTERLGI